MRAWNLMSAILIASSGLAAPFLAAGQDTATNDQATIQQRVQFLQRNFSKFVPAQFRKGTNSEAAIEVLKVKEKMFEHQGTYYCGFKFTVPEWLDGDFEWMYLFAKTEANKDFKTRSKFSWYIIPETGRSEGFEDYQIGGFSRYQKLKAQFPYTGTLVTQVLDKGRLKPGSTFAIWFGFKEQDLPDIAFAMTINSERGLKDFGAL